MNNSDSAIDTHLDVAEGRLANTDGDESDSLVDTAERRDINSLASNGTLGANSGRIFAGTGVDNGVDENLDGVLVREQVDDFESVGDNANSHKLLAATDTRKSVHKVTQKAPECPKESTHLLRPFIIKLAKSRPGLSVAFFKAASEVVYLFTRRSTMGI